MDVRAEGPYEVGSLVFLSSEGAWVFTVIAKVTFALAPEESKVVAQRLFQERDRVYALMLQVRNNY